MNILFTPHFWHQLLCAVIVALLFIASLALIVGVVGAIATLFSNLIHLIRKYKPKRSLEQEIKYADKWQKIHDIFGITVACCVALALLALFISQGLWPAAGWFCERVF